MPQQEGKLGQVWLWVSALVLIVCGIACLAATQDAKGIMDDSIDTACNALGEVVQCADPLCDQRCREEAARAPGAGAASALGTCLEKCQENFDAKKIKSSCRKDFFEGQECYCPTDDADDCDCKNTDYGNLEETWIMICNLLGIVGIAGAVLFTGIPAAVSGWKRVPCVNVVCFSVCSGIWSLIFLACGAGFILLGIMMSPDGEWGRDLQIVCKLDKDSVQEDLENKSVTEFIDCAAQSLCRGISAVQDNVVAASMMIGIPFFIAGLVMFAGCYVCCCCKTSVPQSDETATGGQQQQAPANVAMVPASGEAYVPALPPAHSQSLYPSDKGSLYPSTQRVGIC